MNCAGASCKDGLVAETGTGKGFVRSSSTACNSWGSALLGWVRWVTHSFAPLRAGFLRLASGDSQHTNVLSFWCFFFFFFKHPTTASHLFLLFQACQKVFLFCESVFCAPARVYNFSCFTVVVRRFFAVFVLLPFVVLLLLFLCDFFCVLLFI